MICGDITAIQAYNLYLAKRANMLCLNSKTAEDLAIIKVCNLLRIASLDEASIVKESYINLPVQVKELLTKELTRNGIEDKGILLYYAPATLVNAVNYFKNENYDNPISEAINIVLPVLAVVYGLTRARLNVDKTSEKLCKVLIADLADKSKLPLDLKDYTFNLKNVNNDYQLECEKIEKIVVKSSKKFNIPGKNILVIGLGGGSDCIQATILAKCLLSGRSKNVVSIRTERTASQNEKGEMNKKRTVKNPKEIITEGVYLCDAKTDGEGNF